MKYLFYIFFVYSILFALAYMLNVIVGTLSGQGSLYSSAKIMIFIFSCVAMCASLFLRLKMKILCSIVFFISFLSTSYNDIAVNSIFYSDNEGRELVINMAFFLLGYILPVAGIVVGVRLLMLSQHSKSPTED